MKTLSILLLLVGLLVAIHYAQTGKYEPFTLTQQHVMRCGDGGVAALKKVARRSDGARVTWKHETEGITERTIVLPTAKEIRVFDPLHIKTTMRLHSASAGQMSPLYDCLRGENGEEQRDTKFLGHETVYGIESAKMVVEQPGFRLTAWRALPFGCVTVKQVHEEKNDKGKWEEVSVLETTDIVRGEPIPDLFDTSTDIETDPATAAEKWTRARNPNAPDLDKLVEKARARAEGKQKLYLNYKGKP